MSDTHPLYTPTGIPEYCPGCYPGVKINGRETYCEDHADQEKKAAPEKDDFMSIFPSVPEPNNTDDPAPSIHRIVPADLASADRLTSLYYQAVLHGRWNPKKFDLPHSSALEFVACAKLARRMDRKKSPEKLFAYLLLHPERQNVTAGDEDAAKSFLGDRLYDLAAAGTAALQERSTKAHTGVVTAAARRIRLPLDSTTGILHSVLTNCFLPHHHVPDRRWVSKNGRTTLIVTAGERGDPAQEGRVVSCEVPWGTRARLILPYLIRYALLNNTREIDLGSSAKQWGRKIHLHYGSKMQRAFFRQIENFATSSFRLIGWRDGGSWTRAGHFASGLDLWQSDPDHRSRRWRPVIELSTEFYEALRERRVPVRLDHLRKLARSSRTMDLYVWLASRIFAMQSSQVDVPLTDLHAIFGRDLTNPRDFRRKLHRGLAAIRVQGVWPGLNAEVRGDYLRLRKSSTPFPSFSKSRP